jgi:hypothetical protein
MNSNMYRNPYPKDQNFFKISKKLEKFEIFRQKNFFIFSMNIAHIYIYLNSSH